jgi:hypothetical protein
MAQLIGNRFWPLRDVGPESEAESVGFHGRRGGFDALLVGVYEKKEDIFARRAVSGSTF